MRSQATRTQARDATCAHTRRFLPRPPSDTAVASRLLGGRARGCRGASGVRMSRPDECGPVISPECFSGMDIRKDDGIQRAGQERKDPEERPRCA